MYSQTVQQKRRNGRFSRNALHDRAHTIISSWASSVLIRIASSEGLGYTIGILQDYSGLPPHSLIPHGVNFTSPDELLVENWLSAAPENIQKWTITKYIARRSLNKNYHTEILKSAAKSIFKDGRHSAL